MSDIVSYALEISENDVTCL